MDGDSLLQIDEMLYEIEEERQQGGGQLEYAEDYAGETAIVAFDPLGRDKLWAKTPGGTFFMSGARYCLLLYVQTEKGEDLTLVEGVDEFANNLAGAIAPTGPNSTLTDQALAGFLKKEFCGIPDSGDSKLEDCRDTNEKRRRIPHEDWAAFLETFSDSGFDAIKKLVFVRRELAVLAHCWPTPKATLKFR